MYLLQIICLTLLTLSHHSASIDLAGLPCTDFGDLAPGDCNIYYICNEEVGGGLIWDKYYCPDGEIIDENIDCVPGTCNDGGPPGWTFPCWKYAKDQFLFQDPWDCNSFWQCHHYPQGWAPFKYQCNPGLVFSNLAQYCLRRDNCPYEAISEEIKQDLMSSNYFG